MRKLLFVLGAVTGACFLGNDCLATMTPEKAIEFYKQAYEQAEDAFRVLKEAAVAGNNDAKYQLAMCYTNGRIGVERNPTEAFKLYKQLVEAGYPAKLELAFCYFDGSGVKKDLKAAFKLCKEAADAGNPYAKLPLALWYDGGLGEERNLAEVIRLYREAGCNYKVKILEAIASGKIKG